MTLQHGVFIPIGAFSHLRLMLQLSNNLLVSNPSMVSTIVVTTEFQDKAEAEMALQPEEVKEKIQGRWQLKAVPVDLPAGAGMMRDREAFVAGSKEILSTLLDGKGEGKFSARPGAVVYDIFRGNIRTLLDEIEAQLGTPRIKRLAFSPTMALSTFNKAISAEQGGTWAGHLARFEAFLAEGLDEQTAANKAIRKLDCKIAHWPDLPPMYPFETAPQADARVVDKSTVMISTTVYRSFLGHDGIVCLSVPELEGNSLQKLGEALDCPILGVGPQLSKDIWEGGQKINVESGPENAESSLTFLDQVHQKYGNQSALYISLGTLVWPDKRPELISMIISSLLKVDPPLPFIFTTASSGKVDADLKEKVHASGRGLIVDWAPQVKVLQHPATGIFLTHCGQGSMSETIAAGVPIVAFPFFGDQPELAAFFTQTHQLGIRLDQVSSGLQGFTLGNGVQIIGTFEAIDRELTETWRRMRGEEGQLYRNNVVKIREVMKASWESGGNRKAMEELARYFQA